MDYNYTAEEALTEAAGWQDACFAPGDPGYCEATDADWQFEPEFQLSLIGGDHWIEWFAQEQAYAAEDGREGYYDSMLDREIIEPIVVLMRDGKGYVWDGNHRVGAALSRGLTTISAIVGVPKPVPAMEL
jgi:hypothetical protein